MLYPRYTFNPGDYVILSCSIVDVLEGEPCDMDYITIKGKVFSADINAVYQFKGTLSYEEKYSSYSYKINFFQQDFTMSGQEQADFLSSLITERQYNLLKDALPDPYKTIEDGDIETL